MKSNPSPWTLTKPEFPAILRQGSLGKPSFYDELKKDVAQLIDDTTPSRSTKEIYADGRTRAEVDEEKRKKAEYAKKWLADHATSPIVKEVQAEERVKASKTKQKPRSKNKTLGRRLTY